MHASNDPLKQRIAKDKQELSQLIKTYEGLRATVREERKRIADQRKWLTLRKKNTASLAEYLDFVRESLQDQFSNCPHLLPESLKQQ